ncbi:MAG: glycosyltransferase family 9 protein, partial [Nanoarchaeota archaeon]|nr:glycosyltransferase family 9 protein [Nanoarchaeota archaeon]
RDFFEQFLSKDLSTNLFIPFKNRKVNERYVVFVPGAGANFRRWSPKNFVKVADFIIQEYNLRIKILGSKNDSKIAEEIIHHSRFPEKIENLTGNTLINSIDIIGNSKLLISNDTGMVHIAAATDTFTLCVSNGNQFGEFHPYPKKISKKIYYIYPPKIENEPFEELIKKYSRCSNLDINLITSEEVIKRFDTLLNSTK